MYLSPSRFASKIYSFVKRTITLVWIEKRDLIVQIRRLNHRSEFEEACS